MDGGWPRALIVRSGLLLDDRPEDPVARALTALARGERVEIPESELVSPVWAPHWIDAALDLWVDGERGVWHLASDASSSLELVARAAIRAEVPFAVERTAFAAGGAQGPMRALESARGWPLADLDVTIDAAVEAFRRRLRDSLQHDPA
jgi:dTDP-4-dehydrorhamnose reductase